ncbi:phage tail sheath C-terminal domain-containing protein [Micromonospora sp. NPDC005806]|uniref:phage tail sheath C-terminal domain-containing protein n=1 Tax=Micromonospora sp. NPDC005806 TaxID=3364234 RepID=UPI00368359C0
MAERLHPGVYAEIVDSGIKPIQAVGTATAAFCGESTRGVPGIPVFVRGFADFARSFGGHARGAAGHLAHAVEAFFAAGGSRAFVVRVLPGDAIGGTSDNVLARSDDFWGDDRAVLQVRARGNGAWADNLRVHVAPATAGADRGFRLEVEWVEGGRGRTVERYDNLVLDPESPDYVVDVVADSSRYITVEDRFRTGFLDADPRTAPPLPDRAPTLATLDPGDDVGTPVFRVPAGRAFTVRWSGPDGVGATSTVTFSPTAVTGAGGSITAGVARLTTGQLATLLDTATGALVVTNPTDPHGPVTLAAPVATNAYLVARPTGNAEEFDLSGSTTLILRVSDAADGDADEVTLDVSAMDATPVAELATALRAAVVTANLDDLVAVSAAGRSLVVATSAPRAEGTRLAVSLDAGNPWEVSTRRGAAGTVVDDLALTEIVLSEAPVPGQRALLPQLFGRTRAAGLTESSPLSPDLLPAATGTTPLRLRGGSDGTKAVTSVDLAGAVEPGARTGLRAFDDVDVQLLVLPGRTDPAFLGVAMDYAEARNLFYVADGAGSEDRRFALDTGDVARLVDGLPRRSDNAAMYYPWLEVPDPLGVGRAPTRFVPPSGHVAGVIARTDRTRGVWKAPAGLEASVPNTLDLQHRLLDADQDLLNPIGLNCIRQRPGAGIVTWGSRTLSSDPEWRYVPVRRTALFLLESLRRGLQWVVFEPNDVELWGRIRGNIEAFMLGLHRQGAFQGVTPAEAFVVKCDAETNPQELIDQGIVTAQVAFAPLKPAEFVVVQVSQKTMTAS